MRKRALKKENERLRHQLRIARLANLQVTGHNDFLRYSARDWTETMQKLADGKITIGEVEVIFEACVDYHDVLAYLAIADPIEPRVREIMDRYGIKRLIEPR